MTAIAVDLPPDLVDIVAGLTRFLRAEVVTRHEKHAGLLDDPRRRFGPDGRYAHEVVGLIREVRMAAAEAGYFNLCVPTSLGGLGQGYLTYYVAWEAINRLCGAHHWLGTFALSHWAFGPSAVLEHVTPEARERILSGLMSGRESMCFGLSEPGAGSDATMIQTRAVADGSGWRITGRKMWTSNITFANWIVVFAVTDPARAAAKRGGISAFLVPTSAPGFTLQRVTLLQGEIGGVEGESTLDDVRVEPWQGSTTSVSSPGSSWARCTRDSARPCSASRSGASTIPRARWASRGGRSRRRWRTRDSAWRSGYPSASTRAWPFPSRSRPWRCTARTSWA
jgi:acyl-CoA dehydrogenase